MKYTTPDQLSRSQAYCLRTYLTTQLEPFDYYFNVNHSATASAYFEEQLAANGNDPEVISISLYSFFTGTPSKLMHSTDPNITRQAKRRDIRHHEKLYGNRG